MVKFVATILTIYILLLAVQPALAALDFSKKTECYSHCCGHDSEKPSPEKNQQNNSCNRNCNPLMGCGSCTGFTFSVQPFSLQPASQVSEHNSIYKVLAVSEIALPIWQPPKIGQCFFVPVLRIVHSFR